MRVDGNQGRLEPDKWPRRVKPARDPQAGDAVPSAQPASNAQSDPSVREVSKRSDGMDVHDNAALRETVARLLASGDVKAAEDGSVRQARVDQVRKNFEEGMYSRDDILAGVVDRLLDRWKI